ncbi:MAG: SDR family NAD(P)-dependent oxidoreductase, partial [Candidatus Korobacteraceae bacterium]
LLGRRILLTGAARGIGRDIALTLARAGAQVVLNYRQREQEAQALAQEIVRAGGKAFAVRADISRPAEVSALVQQAMDMLGGIDILVNNAGIAIPKPIEELTEADWDETVDTNLKSAFLVTQAVLPQMRERRWGRLIFISSVAAQVGGVIGPHYAASKSGMHGMMHYYAAHLAKEGITSNVVAPALIRTEMVTNNPRARPELIPVGHFGEPKDVADVVLLLAQNSYITGQTISVNGGWYLT